MMSRRPPVGVFCVDVEELLKATAKLKIDREKVDDRSPTFSTSGPRGSSTKRSSARNSGGRGDCPHSVRPGSMSSAGGAHSPRSSAGRRRMRSRKAKNRGLKAGVEDYTPLGKERGDDGHAVARPLFDFPSPNIVNTTTCSTSRTPICGGFRDPACMQTGDACNDTISCWKNGDQAIRGPESDCTFSSQLQLTIPPGADEDSVGPEQEEKFRLHDGTETAAPPITSERVDPVISNVMQAMQNRLLGVSAALCHRDAAPRDGGTGFTSSEKVSCGQRISNGTNNVAQFSRKVNDSVFLSQPSIYGTEDSKKAAGSWGPPQSLQAARTPRKLAAIGKHGVKEYGQPPRLRDARGVERVLITGVVTKVPKRATSSLGAPQLAKPLLTPVFQNIARNFAEKSKRPKRF
ncbi:hypothetical protein DPX39_100069200 [Trypanosoma brucei equiperdum]|uniref:Uncharacterized protein n=1 Tax=Trypanosoma brucei equiperdum TaxID=630700 RepID=A0A3L6L279_9TRYP|nr:hypothetical protein DPX39_100069200 [Trypanosoma brucei equiperdum]